MSISFNLKGIDYNLTISQFNLRAVCSFTSRGLTFVCSGNN